MPEVWALVARSYANSMTMVAVMAAGPCLKCRVFFIKIMFMVIDNSISGNLTQIGIRL